MKIIFILLLMPISAEALPCLIELSAPLGLEKKAIVVNIEKVSYIEETLGNTRIGFENSSIEVREKASVILEKVKKCQ